MAKTGVAKSRPNANKKQKQLECRTDVFNSDIVKPYHKFQTRNPPLRNRHEVYQ
jgi:hypothetical protein